MPEDTLFEKKRIDTIKHKLYTKADISFERFANEFERIGFVQTREKFSSRLGFILISVGCAIGLGNVYRFPIWCGAYGG